MRNKAKKIILFLICLLLILPKISLAFTPGNLEIIFDFKSNQCFYEGKIEKLQPGSTGEIKIKMINIDKNLQYTIEVKDEKKKPTNLKFYYKGKEFISLENLSSELNGLINSDKEPELIITYLWEYETGTTAEEILENDKIDSIFQNLTYSFSLTLNTENPKPQNEEEEKKEEEKNDNRREEKKKTKVETQEENQTIPEKIKQVFIGVLPRTGVNTSWVEILIKFSLIIICVSGTIFLLIIYIIERSKEKKCEDK